MKFWDFRDGKEIQIDPLVVKVTLRPEDYKEGLGETLVFSKNKKETSSLQDCCYVLMKGSQYPLPNVKIVRNPVTKKIFIRGKENLNCKGVLKIPTDKKFITHIEIYYHPFVYYFFTRNPEDLMFRGRESIGEGFLLRKRIFDISYSTSIDGKTNCEDGAFILGRFENNNDYSFMLQPEFEHSEPLVVDRIKEIAIPIPKVPERNGQSIMKYLYEVWMKNCKTLYGNMEDFENHVDFDMKNVSATSYSTRDILKKRFLIPNHLFSSLVPLIDFDSKQLVCEHELPPEIWIQSLDQNQPCRICRLLSES
jgi:hypothetical protein